MPLGSHRYDIVLKKGNLLIELTSDDVYFIAKQMNKWFDILINDAYVSVTLPVRKKAAAAVTKSLAPPPPQSVETSPQKAPRQRSLESAQPSAESLPVENLEPEVSRAPATRGIRPKERPVENPVERPVETPRARSLQAASLGVREIEPIPEPVLEESVAQPEMPPVAPARVPRTPPQEEPTPGLPAGVKDDFEAVMDTILEDLNQEDEEPSSSMPSIGFSLPEPTPQSEMAMVDSLPELYARSSAKTPEDFLMLSAYYLTYVDSEERFSLKRINALLIRSGYTALTHSTLEIVLSQGYLAMVPDFTGTAEATEYSLTPSGQAFANQLL